MASATLTRTVSGARKMRSFHYTLLSKLAKSANPDPPNGSLEEADDANGSLSGANGSLLAIGDLAALDTGGAGRWGPLPAAPVALGGAGRGGGCLDFLGGSAGVGLSTRDDVLEPVAAVKGSLPNGSAPVFCN